MLESGPLGGWVGVVSIRQWQGDRLPWPNRLREGGLRGMTIRQTSVEGDPLSTAQVDQCEAFKRTLQGRFQLGRILNVSANERHLGIRKRRIPWESCLTDNSVFGRFPVDISELHLEKSHVGVVVMPNAHLESDVFPPDMVVQTTAVDRVEIQVVVLGRDFVLDGQNLMF